MLVFLKAKDKFSGSHRTAISNAVKCRCNNIQYVGKMFHIELFQTFRITNFGAILLLGEHNQ